MQSESNHDVQNEAKPQQIVPCDVLMDWVFEKYLSVFKVENVAEIEAVFGKHFA